VTDRKTRARRSLTVLRPVDVTEDGRALLLAPPRGRKGSFLLQVGPELVAQLEAARERVRAAAEPPTPTVFSRPESKLTPKEIQSLLRRGQTVAAVAKRAGVDPAWVERFEGPIVWERAGMAARAQRARLVRPRLGTSSVSLGDAVRTNLRRRKVTVPAEQLDAAWDAVRRGRGRKWVVRLALPGARRGLAEWEFDAESERLTALNHLASELGWVEPRRRR
jgi:hypothetical protein